MTNGFFNHDNPEARRTLARAESINATFQAVSEGFDKLPTELELKQGRTTYAAATGGPTAYVVTLSYAPQAYVEGMHVAFKVPSTNPGACTVNVNGLGAKTIKRIGGEDTLPRDLYAGGIIELRYDGTAFRIVATQYGDILLARDWAQKTGDTVYGTGYSAKEHAQGTTVPTGSSMQWAEVTGTIVGGVGYSAKEHAQGSVVPTGSAKQWAETTGAVVGGSGYSAKEHAVGSTVPTGSAKNWATYVAGLVGGSDYSAKEYATGSQAGTGGSAKNWAQQSGGVTGAAAGSFSAKDWATKTGGTVDGTFYSAQQYSLNAAQSASNASTSETNAAASAAAAAAAVANTNSIWCGTAGGTSTALILTPATPLAAYVAGLTIRFKASIANGGASTVNVSGLGTRGLKTADGASLGPNAITAGTVVEATYDGTEFRQSGGGGANLSTIHAAMFSI